MAYSEHTLNFFENIRALRRKHNLTMEEMASRLDIDVAELQLLEQNILPETLEVVFLENLCREFHFSFARMFKSPDFQ